MNLFTYTIKKLLPICLTILLATLTHSTYSQKSDSLSKPILTLTDKGVRQDTLNNAPPRPLLKVIDPIYNVPAEETLTFHFEILPDGTVGEIREPESGNPDLIKAGMNAIRQWKFSSAPGEPILWTKVSVSFKLK